MLVEQRFGQAPLHSITAAASWFSHGQDMAWICAPPNPGFGETGGTGADLAPSRGQRAQLNLGEVLVLGKDAGPLMSFNHITYFTYYFYNFISCSYLIHWFYVNLYYYYALEFIFIFLNLLYLIFFQYFICYSSIF